MKAQIIPRVESCETFSGQFTADAKAVITADSASSPAAALLAELLHAAIGAKYAVRAKAPEKHAGGCIALKVSKKTAAALGPGGYELAVAEKNISIAAADADGAFHAVQSLRQLWPPDAEKRHAAVLEVPCLKISDRPRFRWRGIMLDTARHFMPKEFVLRYIDTMAMLKFNVLHLHITDDQGWRIEIRKYPELTRTGAWRKKSAGLSPNNCGPAHGGFYSQDDIREIVSHAAARGITVLPEIDMPGHAIAAIASVPGLACRRGPFEVRTQWGISKDVLCAGRESTFAFVQDILDEVMELFPSEYIHAGGDECPKDRWRECPACQARIKSEGLKDENGLQSYFMRRVAEYLRAHGRRLVGWDEILDGGLPEGATVMSWRGMKGGIAAARLGHDAVMCPTSHCYFDYAQGLAGEPQAIPFQFLPLCRVYSLDPVPQYLTPSQASHILGVQGNLWTEFVPDTRHAEYMTYPRAAALAEVAWTQQPLRDWADFKPRLAHMKRRFDVMGVNYRRDNPDESARLEYILKNYPNLWDAADKFKYDVIEKILSLLP